MLKQLVTGLIDNTAVKGRAGGLAGALLAVAEPAVGAFANGFAAGVLPNIEQLGLMAGQAAGGFVIGYVITWFSASNAPGPESGAANKAP